ncbi:PrsW family intramembrane metalloprotease [Dermabacteraceae bacterium TAE3-ERU27]|nr:PrsW family intramembrane metalloprotease [Dermabacteraceae bacterium TAE3-ERU27]
MSAPLFTPIQQTPPAPRKPRRWRRYIGKGLTWGAFAVMLLAIAVFMGLQLGFGLTLAAGGAALIPFGMLFLVIRWIDRFTPEPRGALFFAFAWGAIASVFAALVLGGVIEVALAFNGATREAANFIGPVIQAPLVEEGAKSAGILILLIFGRRYIAGPIDGIVYAALIAAGFAFTENILYFGRALQESGISGDSSNFWAVFVMRGVFSPFAHVCFTSLAGFGAGVAAERRYLPLYFTLLPGMIGFGMLLHALWNGSGFYLPALGFGQNASAILVWYLALQVPIFLFLGSVVIWLRWREKKILRRQLTVYGRAGWFSPQEVEMMVSLRKRRRARRWAARSGALPLAAMREFQLAAGELAVQRNAAINGEFGEKARRTEMSLLERVTAARRKLSALSYPVVATPPPHTS